MCSILRILLVVLLLQSPNCSTALSLAPGSFRNRLTICKYDSCLLFLQTAPLIGGPSWLPLHVKVVLETDTKSRHKWDFVPLNATSSSTLQRLVTLQGVPAEIRYSMTQYEKKDTQDPSHQLLEAHELIERAQSFCDTYPERDLHIVQNNCWTFALRLAQHLNKSLR